MMGDIRGQHYGRERQRRAYERQRRALTGYAALQSQLARCAQGEHEPKQIQKGWVHYHPTLKHQLRAGETYCIACYKSLRAD